MTDNQKPSMLNLVNYLADCKIIKKKKSIPFNASSRQRRFYRQK